MKKTTSSEIKRGQAITFRIPSDTPDSYVITAAEVKRNGKTEFF